MVKFSCPEVAGFQLYVNKSDTSTVCCTGCEVDMTATLSDIQEIGANKCLAISGTCQ